MCGGCTADIARNLLAAAREHQAQLQSRSPKFCVIQRLLQYCKDANEKLVIFSENLATLDSVEVMLQVLHTQAYADYIDASA